MAAGSPAGSASARLVAALGPPSYRGLWVVTGVGFLIGIVGFANLEFGVALAGNVLALLSIVLQASLQSVAHDGKVGAWSPGPGDPSLAPLAQCPQCGRTYFPGTGRACPTCGSDLVLSG